ncbi:MAG: hypothetical protein KatS3mg059_0264 [Thermomicrobiales bacterium]|nr:MAG: hypothetical protein KatS3mg059_0264 [Thermomicrobiales bacterium]
MPRLSAAEYRRRFLEMAKRRAKPGSGSSLEFLRSRTWRKPAVEIPPLKTPFVVVGAVATWLYMPQRATRDVDILIRASDAPAIAAELQQAGFVQTGRLSIGGTSWRAPNGAVLVVLESDVPWIDDALAKPNRSPDGLPVIALPHLVLLKLAAGRGQDLVDIQRMLGQADEQTLHAVRDVVQRHRPADLDDLDSLIELGRLEYLGDSGEPGPNTHR